MSGTFWGFCVAAGSNDTRTRSRHPFHGSVAILLCYLIFNFQQQCLPACLLPLSVPQSISPCLLLSIRSTPLKLPSSPSPILPIAFVLPYFSSSSSSPSLLPIQHSIITLSEHDQLDVHPSIANTITVMWSVPSIPMLSFAFLFLLLLPSTLGDASPVKIPLSGGLLHIAGFYFNAKLGGQSLTFQVDTSYSSLIVPRKGCVGCRLGDRRYDPDASKSSSVIKCDSPKCAKPPAECAFSRCFSCSASGQCCVEGTNNCAFNVLYGDNSSGNGTMFTDTLEVGDLKANLMFGAMHEESHNFELPYADGVFGLAFKRGACRPGCIPPAMDALVNETGIQNVFTMCVAQHGGTLVLGDAHQALATKPFQYVDMSSVADDNRFIIPALTDWKIADRSLTVPGVTNAMFTAGTTNIGVAKDTFLRILDHLHEHYCHIQGLCSMESWFRPQRCAAIPQNVVDQMPNITMGLTKGVSITLTAEDYLIKYRVINGEQHRCLAFIVTDSLAKKGIGLLLGITVMQRYAVVYDREKKRIGVAPAKAGECGPTSGSDVGLPGSQQGQEGSGPVLTADSPAAKNTTQGSNDPVQQELQQAEICRSQLSCGSCSSLSHCSYSYQTGRCVPVEEAGKTPYPFCTGMLCVCIAVGTSGWYLGLIIGGLAATAIVGVCVMIMRWRKRRNTYQRVEGYEEQDLETF